MNLYFVRHGETKANSKKLYYGRMDINLTQKGKCQAERLSGLLGSIDFDMIYTSEKKRALKTARIIVKDVEKRIIVDKRINEMDMGDFEGKSYQDIEKCYPREWKMWCSDWKNVIPPGGESYTQFYLRVKSFMDYLKTLNCENVLIVTHSGVIRSIYCYVLGGNIDFFWKFSSHNGEVSLIKYEYNNLYIDNIVCMDSIDKWKRLEK
ncbi:alpha-ribazole phosphatase [Clostridium tyrobutyricum]|uniref:Alpha-ribazole phosphatase n=2 Tax=Clostridium tyrobutyricum TaxID=1519 RepID=W6N805_CLOTY|nr:alpha-ribazole phosphatase [Clostridium tyrobutyricum]AND85803.1 alpha-ribazole-5'-phosphate phosphatase [Clostridium tyrobutyricum]ANP70319.1 alpha-ribazole phosphatase [Clostridium tyrobutyricum]MBV4416401.1 alpha-ribazole phosphatase [Clostridium tyrobutyricum]MBV4422528.1 alpha-ribazole phosphatase [Clostridium tyrobutyricum]MBV4424533.1 alpha-ribazole phosphatase [Clostridium tyrobutyricum]